MQGSWNKIRNCLFIEVCKNVVKQKLPFPSIFQMRQLESIYFFFKYKESSILFESFLSKISRQNASLC